MSTSDLFSFLDAPPDDNDEDVSLQDVTEQQRADLLQQLSSRKYSLPDICSHSMAQSWFVDATD